MKGVRHFARRADPDSTLCGRVVEFGRPLHRDWPDCKVCVAKANALELPIPTLVTNRAGWALTERPEGLSSGTGSTFTATNWRVTWKQAS